MASLTEQLIAIPPVFLSDAIARIYTPTLNANVTATIAGLRFHSEDTQDELEVLIGIHPALTSTAAGVPGATTAPTDSAARRIDRTPVPALDTRSARVGRDQGLRGHATTPDVLYGAVLFNGALGSGKTASIVLTGLVVETLYTP